jgi:hypothetical protein
MENYMKFIDDKLTKPIMKVIHIATKKSIFFYTEKSFDDFSSTNDMTQYNFIYYIGLGSL